MTTRSRESSTPGFTGSSTWNSGPPVYQKSAGNKSICYDEADSPGDENVLDLTHMRQLSISAINGSRGLSTFSNYPPSCSWSHFNPPFSIPNEKYLDANSAVAASHPGEPAVELPVFLFELKDIPDMLRHAYMRGRSFEKAMGLRPGSARKQAKEYLKNPNNPAEDWLNYNFGWRPFLQDAAAIAGLADHTRKQQQLFSKWSKGFISRRSDLGSNSHNTYHPNDVFCTSTGTFGNSSIQNNSRRWIVSKWKVEERTYEAFASNRGYQIRAALGLDAGIHHVWNAMPWTWLVDWFSSIGDVVTIRSNRFGVSFWKASMMTEYEIKKQITPYPKSGLTMGSCAFQKIRKTRVPWGPSININRSLNFLGEGQLATLTSLAVTRGKNSWRF